MTLSLLCSRSLHDHFVLLLMPLFNFVYILRNWTNTLVLVPPYYSHSVPLFAPQQNAVLQYPTYFREGTTHKLKPSPILLPSSDIHLTLFQSKLWTYSSLTPVLTHNTWAVYRLPQKSSNPTKLLVTLGSIIYKVIKGDCWNFRGWCCQLTFS